MASLEDLINFQKHISDEWIPKWKAHFKDTKLTAKQAFFYINVAAELAHSNFLLLSDSSFEIPTERVFFIHDEAWQRGAAIVYQKVKAMGFDSQGVLTEDALEVTKQIEGLYQWAILERALVIIDQMLDAVKYGGYEVHEGEDSWVISKAKHFNKRRLLLKNHYRKAFYHLNSVKEVSHDPFFQKTDPRYKTDQGIVGSVSLNKVKGEGATLTSDNMASLELADFPEIRDDPELSDSDKGLIIAHQQYRNYYYRQALQGIFRPVDEELVSDILINTKNGEEIAVLDIFKVIAAIQSELRGRSYWERIYGLSAIKKACFHHLTQDINEKLSLEQIHHADHDFINYFILDNEPTEGFSKMFPLKTFFQLSQSSVQSLIQKKTLLSEERIEATLHFLQTEELPYPIMAEDQDNYVFFRQAFIQENISAFLYDKHFSSRRFDVKIAGASATQTADKRARELAKSLEKIIMDKWGVGIQTASNWKFHFTSEIGTELHGDMDLLVYHPGENLLLLVEIKCSNTDKDTFAARKSWWKTHIEKKALNIQFPKYIQVLQSPKGRKLLKSKKKLNMESTPTIIPILLTDHFYFDHESIPFPEVAAGNIRTMSLFEVILLCKELSLFPPDSPAWIKWWVYYLENHAETEVPKEMLQWAQSNEKLSNSDKTYSHFKEFISLHKSSLWPEKPRLTDFVQLYDKNVLWGFLEWILPHYHPQARLEVFTREQGPLLKW